MLSTIRELALFSLMTLFYLYELIVRKIFGPKIYAAEDVQGKVVIVTGANSGLGKAVAMNFAKRKAVVVMACRNMTEGRKAQDEIVNVSKADRSKIDLIQLDLGDLTSVRKCADVILKKYPEIDILVANAGYTTFSPQLQKTEDGFESHIGVNHLGHFLLVNLLLPNLKKPSASRVVVVASSAQLLANFDPKDINMTQLKSTGFENMIPYANSKYCNSLFASTLAEKLRGSGVTTYSVCPGYVDSGFFRDMPEEKVGSLKFTLKLAGLSPDQGAEVIIYCALAKELAHESGDFYRFCGKRWFYNMMLKRNRITALQLWDVSERLVSLKK